MPNFWIDLNVQFVLLDPCWVVKDIWTSMVKLPIFYSHSHPIRKYANTQKSEHQPISHRKTPNHIWHPNLPIHSCTWKTNASTLAAPGSRSESTRCLDWNCFFTSDDCWQCCWMCWVHKKKSLLNLVWNHINEQEPSKNSHSSQRRSPPTYVCSLLCRSKCSFMFEKSFLWWYTWFTAWIKIWGRKNVPCDEVLLFSFRETLREI